MTRLAAQDAGSANVCAFLDMLAWSEMKPALLAVSDDGYNVIVGSTAAHPRLFHSYADHPRVFVDLSPTLRSSAAGRYQFLARTWDALAKRLGLKDFSPESQDWAAIELLSECKAYAHIVGGQIKTGIQLAAPIWASLPGAGYGQHENDVDELLAVYASALAKVPGSADLPANFSNVIGGSSWAQQPQ